MWNSMSIDLQDCEVGHYSLSATATLRHTSTTFKLTAVYGPSRAPEKDTFLRHLRRLKPIDDARWLVLGDFNLIYRAHDKNNNNLNLRTMRKFRRVLNRCQLKEIHL